MRLRASCVLLAVVEAGVFQLPITRTTIGWRFRFRDSSEDDEGGYYNLAKHDVCRRSRKKHQAPLGIQGRPPTGNHDKKFFSLFDHDQKHQAPLVPNPTCKVRHVSAQNQDAENDRVLDFMSPLTRLLSTNLLHPDNDVVYWSLYTAPVSIGTPPLNLYALINTSWGPFFVPSVNGTFDPHERPYFSRHPLYNSSLSSTYQADLTPAKLVYLSYDGIYTRGNVSVDSLGVGGMEIKEQRFEEATWWRPGHFTTDDLFDTALGLSLHRTNSSYDNFNESSPFMNMVEQGLLDQNLFTLQLSRTDNELGEITFGGLPEKVRREDLVEIPLDHSRDGNGDEVWSFFASNGWQVSVQNISMGLNSFHADDTSVPILTDEHTAVISTGTPWIHLPGEAAKAANTYIGLSEPMEWVDCETRSVLPDMTFTFGPNGQTLILTPWDYLVELYDDMDEQLKCISVFVSLNEAGGKGFIALGAAFLNGVYSVFDADRKSISFKNRPL